MAALRWTMLAGPVVAGAVLAVAACHREPSPAERARDDARAVAMVEAAQRSRPPAVALTPQPITAADLVTSRLAGGGCKVTARDIVTPDTRSPPEAGAGDVLLVANERRAIAKVAGRLMIFAADTGAETAGPRVMRHYVGKSHALTIERVEGDGAEIGAEELRWPTTLTVRDAWDQVVFTTPAQLVCSP